MTNLLLNHLWRLGPRMPAIRILAFFVAFASFPLLSSAANLTLQGNFTADDNVQLFSVSVAAPAAVDFRSYGYGGGMTSTGTVVPRGGFDTILTLFSSSGVFLNENDDGAGAAEDPATGMSGDARITANLAAGSYILALTQYDNFSIGDLADGFAETGHPNFTADPGFANGGACAGNMFRDISGADGRCRTGNWTVDFLNISSVAPIAVPEPSALLLAGVGLALLLAGRLRSRKKETLLAVILLAALATSPVEAQSDPDFTNVNDILHGNRTLLQITDLQVVTWQKDSTQLNFNQLLTSNSSVTKTSSSSANIPPDIYNPYGTKSFSGLMFNQSQPVTVTEVAAEETESNLYLVTTNIQSAGPWFSPIQEYNAFQFTAGAMADFNNDGYDDFAFSFDDGNIGIATAADVNNPGAGSSGPFKLGPLTQLDKLTDMTAGDFKGDGQHEIAGLNFTVVDGIQLVIYTVDPNSLAISAANSLVLNTPLGYAIAYASIAKGRFNTTTRDQLVVTFSSAAGPSIVQIIDFMPGTLTPVAGPQLTISTVAIPAGYLQIATGKFGLPDNSYDQIVFHMSSTSGGGRFFQVVSASQTDLTLTAHSGVTYDQYPCAAGIQVGNFDNQQTNQHNPNSQVALLYCSSDATTSTMNIYSVDSQTFDVQSSTPTQYPLSVSSLNTSFVATDLQGRSMVLGDPTIVTIDNTTPSVITAAPPMHIDYITPVLANKPQVLNLSFIPDGFNNAFNLAQASKTGGSTTHKLSWSAGVDLSVGYSYTVGDPDNATGARFSAAFDAADKVTGSSDNSTITYSTSTFDVGATTTTGDAVYVDQSRLNIWVYPVIGQTACPASLKNPNCTPDEQKPLTIQFSGPDQINSGVVSASDLSTNSYQPPWEFGNIFSYPATKDQLALIFPDLANTQLSSELSFNTDNLNQRIQASWSSSGEKDKTTSLTNDASFDASMSGVDAIGLKGFGTAKVNESVKLSASLGYANLQTNTAEVDASDGVLIQATATFPDPGNYAYAVMPFILGNPPPSQQVGDSQQPPQADISTIGPLRTAFTADPINTGAWWKQAYSSAPDIALNHPSRWIVTKEQLPSNNDPIPANCAATGNGNYPMDCADIAPLYDDTHQPLNPWNSNFLSMHGFFITPADNPGAGPQLQVATAGDQLDLAVRVYNYSLATIPDGSTVHVRFYAMPWDNSNDVPAGDSILIGETVADPVPAFSDTASDLNWRLVHLPPSAPAFDTTPYAGKFLVFWVVVWMQDGNGNLVTEIPGHGLTSIPGALTKPSDVPLEMTTSVDGTAIVSYSNNVGFYHYAFPVLPAPGGGLGAVLPAPSGGLGAPPPDNPEDISLKSVSAAKQRLQPGKLDEITAVLRSGSEGTRPLKVYFYDGDPDNGGRLIGIEPAWFQPRSITKVRLPYHPATDGVYQIWAVINKGKPYQTMRHTAAIVVGKAKADRNNSGGDLPPGGKDDNPADKN